MLSLKQWKQFSMIFIIAFILINESICEEKAQIQSTIPLNQIPSTFFDTSTSYIKTQEKSNPKELNDIQQTTEILNLTSIKSTLFSKNGLLGSTQIIDDEIDSTILKTITRTEEATQNKTINSIINESYDTLISQSVSTIQDTIQTSDIIQTSNIKSSNINTIHEEDTFSSNIPQPITTEITTALSSNGSFLLSTQIDPTNDDIFSTNPLIKELTSSIISDSEIGSITAEIPGPISSLLNTENITEEVNFSTSSEETKSTNEIFSDTQGYLKTNSEVIFPSLETKETSIITSPSLETEETSIITSPSLETEEKSIITSPSLETEETSIITSLSLETEETSIITSLSLETEETSIITSPYTIIQK